jgi:hypothetical protein
MSARSTVLVGLALLAFQPFTAADQPNQPDVRAMARRAWLFEYDELSGQIAGLKNWQGVARDRLEAEALDPRALVSAADRDPLDVVLRRTTALLDHHHNNGTMKGSQLDGFQSRLEQLSDRAEAADEPVKRKELFYQVCQLRREIVFANPLLDFDSIVCMLEQPGNARIIEQGRACWGGHAKGGGPIIVANFETQTTIEAPLADVRVAEGPWQGKTLTGYFSGLELDFDAKRLLFAATTDTDVWRIFRYDLIDKSLVQLTDGPTDDFDPCVLPSGRIVFTSTRRGGIGRCYIPKQALTYTLHSMEPDGSDVVTLSYHETNEWQPSVNHRGMLVYTRWDYVDRWWASAHHLWTSFPDGRDPRNLHGNYPKPWSAFPEESVTPKDYGHNRLANGRIARPDVEISFRAIPNSPRYTATAVGHHMGFSGSLVMVDPRIPDDGAMGQAKRITPEYPFPEVERFGSGERKDAELFAYGTAWPLSEDFYLCNFHTGLYLLDRFGNREVIYDPFAGPHRVRDPFPLRPRETPPAIPEQTWQGKRTGLADHRRATIKVTNVYVGDMPLPLGTKVTAMRIVQLIPQIRTKIDKETISLMSFADESLGRIPLGVVPVEEDGSVYCEAPVGKALYFQLLDEEGMAVQSMRSATYVHPGEQMSCVGCHEDKWQAMPAMPAPEAFKRSPSKIKPEVESGAIPFNFYKLVKEPVFDKKCVECHAEHPKAPDMSYKSLARNDIAFGLPGEIGMRMVGTGASRTTPGKFGARASGLVKSLKTKDYHKGLELTKDDWRRITLWLDMNSNEIGWIGDDRAQIEAQKRGENLWPPIDIDPDNPTGVEKDYPTARRTGR